MQVADSATKSPASGANHRGGGISFQRLLNGTPGAPDNFELSIVEFTTEYRTPRHHHNFDQLHYVLSGTHEYAPGQHMEQGTVTYFPEGAYYGPQSAHGALVIGLQFAGASGNGFMSYEQLAEGNGRLRARGRFENGIFRYVDEKGKHRNQDGYEAIWEEINGRPVEYPSPRYHQPVVMRPDDFGWISNPAEPGVQEKSLGCFTERRTTIGLVKLAAGARHEIPARAAIDLYVVLRGEVKYGDKSYGELAAFKFERDETAELEAISEAELYLVRLPEFG